jgi:hypothetical protein
VRFSSNLVSLQLRYSGVTVVSQQSDLSRVDRGACERGDGDPKAAGERSLRTEKEWAIRMEGERYMLHKQERE